MTPLTLRHTATPHPAAAAPSALDINDAAKDSSFETPYRQVFSPSRPVTVRGETFDLGSDWHLPMETGAVRRFMHSLLASKTADIFVCAGDIFDAHGDRDTSLWTSGLLTEIANHYSVVLYTPGNHCLRSRIDPWHGFNIPENVIMPVEDKPCVVKTENNKILLGNIFYDFRLVDPGEVETSIHTIRDLYRSTHDGSFLCGGDTSLFVSMANKLARALTPDITLLVTHTLPHPAAITFHVEHLSVKHRKLSEERGMSFRSDPEADLQAAKKWGISPELARAWWNSRCFTLGSDVINHIDADPRDGLVAMYGHNHQGDTQTVRAANGSRIRLVTHQRKY